MSAQVQSFLLERRQAEDSLYLLVNPLAECDEHHPLSLSSFRQEHGEARVATILRPDLAHTPPACPALLQLAAPGQDLPTRYLSLSEDYAQQDMQYRRRYVYGWLLCDQAPEVLAVHMAAHCWFEQRSAQRQCIPWFEPLRMELLAASSANMLGALLGPVHTSLFPTSWGTFTAYQGLPHALAELPPQAWETQRLTPLISDLLTAWRQALTQLHSFAPWQWKGQTLLPPQAAAHAFRLIRDARKQGLRDQDDILTLSLHRLFIHPQLPGHPTVQSDIRCAATGQRSLADSFQAYDDRAWINIVASLPRAKEYS
ncbi:hypothetical protein AADU03_004934 [Escherichia coli]